MLSTLDQPVGRRKVGSKPRPSRTVPLTRRLPGVANTAEFDSRLAVLLREAARAAVRPTKRRDVFDPYQAVDDWCVRLDKQLSPIAPGGRAWCDRVRDRLCLYAEAGLLGRIRYFGANDCSYRYARLLTDVRKVAERTETSEEVVDPKSGRKIARGDRSVAVRRVTETRETTEEFDVTVSLQSNEHFLTSLRFWTVDEAKRGLAMPRRIREFLDVVSRTPLHKLFQCVSGDLYGRTQSTEQVSRTQRSVRSKTEHVWYACEPAVVLQPLRLVFAGWLDAGDD